MNEPPTTLRKHGKTFTQFCVRTFWEAYGCSWRGRVTKRDGKRVRCGHRHRSRDAALRCREKMRRERPGKCQDYQVHELHEVGYKATHPERPER